MRIIIVALLGLFIAPIASAAPMKKIVTSSELITVQYNPGTKGTKTTRQPKERCRTYNGSSGPRRVCM
jgi:hypothetical protein